MSDSPTNSFAATVTIFRDIALLRRGPADLPVSGALLLLTIAAQLIVELVLGTILPPSAAELKAGVQDHLLALLLIDLVVTLLWGWAILTLAGKPERFLQTMTAVFGFLLVFQPVLESTAWFASLAGKESGWALLALLLVTALAVWATVVTARILRAATDWSMFACVALVLAQGGLTWLVTVAMFPEMAELLKQGL